MTHTTTTRRHGTAMLLLVVCAFFALAAGSQQGSTPPVDERKAPPPSAYAGDAACAECHQREAKAYAATPHALDSEAANAKDILGSFTPPTNVLHTGDPDLTFVMTKTPNGFYQSAVRQSDPSRAPEPKRMDIVIGSGRHGQTYLYWQDDQLYELPVSYWTYLHRWVNSPGYLDGVVQWYRPAIPRCLECHSSYFTSIAPPNRYVKLSLVLGIGCERCHGPGAAHVSRERSTPPPRGSAAEAIVNPAHLSREKQLSLCSLCHAGVAESIGPSMTYVVGDNIEDFLDILPPSPNAPVDVHGNQVGAMEQSKCFRSGKLTCSTCHNVHETQENAEAFSGHCLECHQVSACGKFRAMGAAIRGKCVDCHMPLGQSRAITSANAGQDLQATMRTHRIAIYPEATISDKAVPGGQKGH